MSILELIYFIYGAFLATLFVVELRRNRRQYQQRGFDVLPPR
jgi:hypothetical protein